MCKRIFLFLLHVEKWVHGGKRIINRVRVEKCILTEERACTVIVSQQEINIVIINKCNLEYRRQGFYCIDIWHLGNNGGFVLLH